MPSSRLPLMGSSSGNPAWHLSTLRDPRHRQATNSLALHSFPLAGQARLASLGHQEVE